MHSLIGIYIAEGGANHDLHLPFLNEWIYFSMA
jgi:hypothetical protein